MERKIINFEQIDEAIEDAQLAFWASVVKSFPEITTGDFPPGDSMQFDFESTEAVRAWVSYNSPTGDEK